MHIFFKPFTTGINYDAACCNDFYESPISDLLVTLLVTTPFFLYVNLKFFTLKIYLI